jgi:outer membrane cobalamin receptor
MAAFAHMGSVRGLIRDAKSGLPLEGANVYISGRSYAAVTDVFGAFMIRGVEPGKYILVTKHIGYVAVQEDIKVEDGITTETSLSLQSSEVQLTDVTINAKKDAMLSTISALDMKLRPINTAQDMMRMVPGLFTSQHQGGGKAEQMFLRGFDVDHGTDVAVSVDGMPVNMVSHAHGQGYADLHFLIPELVDKMSFGKGPYEIDKGDFATAGWAEFKTKNYLDHSFIKLEGGSYGYFRAVTGIDLLGNAGAARNEGAYVAGEYGYNRGYFNRPQDFNRINLTGKYTKQFSRDRLLSITASGFKSDWDASGQIPERAIAEGLIGRFGEIDKEGGKTGRYNLNIQYTQAISRNETFKSNLWASYYDFSLYSNFTFFLNDSVNGDQIHQAEKRFLAGYNAEYANTYYIGKLHTRTQVGAGFRYDATDGSELSHTRDMSEVLERIRLGDIHQTNAFGYVNQTFFLRPNLVANAGTRVDFFNHAYTDKLTSDQAKASIANHAFSPKAGIYYNFSNSGRVYVNAGIGFHSNDTRVVVAHSGKDVLPLARSIEVGTVFKLLPRMLVSAAIFRIDLDQEFVYVGDEGVVEPGGRTRRQGVDLSVRYEAAKWLYFDADFNYTHARARDAASGQDNIPLAPRLTSIGGATVRQGAWSASLRYRHMGDRPANEDASTTASGYTVCDLAASYTHKKYELGFQIQNLFNTDWNEAQFDTETRLRAEPAPVSEICFTPGTPFAIKLIGVYQF